MSKTIECKEIRLSPDSMTRVGKTTIILHLGAALPWIMAGAKVTVSAVKK